MSAAARPDAASKVRGAVEYGTDLSEAGMWWGALVLAAVAHGELRSVDLSAARAVPSTVAICASDVQRLTGSSTGDADRPPFPAHKVVYRYQPVAAVAAPSLALAREAARAVRVEVSALPALADIEAIFPEWPGSDAGTSPHVAAHVHARHGDVDRALEGAETVVRETYRTAGVHQVALEPHACLANAAEGRWRVQTSTQSPFGAREDVATILGIPEASVEVLGSWVGGGFGGKGASMLEPYALLLSKEAGRPVKLALSYREEFRLGRSTQPLIARLETGVRAGRIVARRVRLLLDVGTSLPGRDFATGYAIGFLLGPYSTESFEMEGYAVRTNKPPFGPHRAPVAPQAAFVAESHMNEVARVLGVDPDEFRAKHLWKEGSSTLLGQSVGPFGISDAFARARERAASWRVSLPDGHGVGIGLGFWSTGTGAGGEARVVLTPERLLIEQGEREIGSGSVLVGLAAVASRRSGLPTEAIRVDYRGTSEAPFDSGVYGSRTLGALGRAVDQATGTLLEELGRRLGNTAPAVLEGRPDGIWARAGTAVRPVAELLTEAERADGGMRSEGRHFGPERTIDARRVLEGSFYPYQDFTGAAHVAEVAVDRASGAVRVVRYSAFHDAGTVVDPGSATAQVEGGIVMGLGAALTEEALWSEDGELLNDGLLDYRIPTLGEVPPIEVTFVEGFSGAGPFGAKGLGEPPIIPVPATIAAALRDAVGVHLIELPLSPERVARAVKAGRPSGRVDAARAG